MRLIASRHGSSYSYSECSGDDRCHCCSLSASKDSLETSILDPRHFATHHKRHLQSAHSTQGCLLKLFAFFCLESCTRSFNALVFSMFLAPRIRSIKKAVFYHWVPVLRHSFYDRKWPCCFANRLSKTNRFVEVMENQWIGFPSGRLVDNLQTF